MYLLKTFLDSSGRHERKQLKTVDTTGPVQSSVPEFSKKKQGDSAVTYEGKPSWLWLKTFKLYSKQFDLILFGRKSIRKTQYATKT